MSSEKFEDYDEELKTILDTIDRALKIKLPRLSGEQRKAELRNAGKEMDEALFLLNQMTEEAQAAPGSFRSQMMSKVRGYRNQLDKLKKDMSKIAAPVGASKEDLLGEPPDPMIAQRNRMLEGLESLDRSSASVERSRRIAAETDEYGVQIISDLEGQRESLLRSRDKVKQTHEDLGRSRRILNSMGIRLATNKVIMIMIIFLELVILGAVVYIRFFKGN